MDKSVSIIISSNAIAAPIVENNPPNPHIMNQKLKNSKSYSWFSFLYVNIPDTSGFGLSTGPFDFSR